MQRTMLAAVQATDEQLIAPRYLMRISAHLAFYSSAQKDDSHWGPAYGLATCEHSSSKDGFKYLKHMQ